MKDGDFDLTVIRVQCLPPILSIMALKNCGGKAPVQNALIMHTNVTMIATCRGFHGNSKTIDMASSQN